MNEQPENHSRDYPDDGAVRKSLRPLRVTGVVCFLEQLDFNWGNGGYPCPCYEEFAGYLFETIPGGANRPIYCNKLSVDEQNAYDYLDSNRKR